jgi:hypothetical protein
VNGARSDQTNITLDGVDNNDELLGTAFTGAIREPLDAVEELKVTTSNSDADTGRSSGGQVSEVTKSGTNRSTSTTGLPSPPRMTGSTRPLRLEPVSPTRLRSCCVTRLERMSAGPSSRTGCFSLPPTKASASARTCRSHVSFLADLIRWAQGCEAAPSAILAPRIRPARPAG